MDFPGFLTTLSGALNFGQSLVGIRDSNKLQSAVSELIGKLLEARKQALELANVHQGTVDELFDAKQEIRDLRHRLSQKVEYELVFLSEGAAVYRRREGIPQALACEQPGAQKVPVYACQPCMAGGHEIILRLSDRYAKFCWVCPRCDAKIFTEDPVEPL